MIIIAVLALLVLVLILIVLWQLAADVRTILNVKMPELLSALSRKPAPLGSDGGTGRHGHEGGPHEHKNKRALIGCFVIWIWRNGEWHPQAVPYGIRPGSPPAYAGTFTGDTAKTWVTTNR